MTQNNPQDIKEVEAGARQAKTRAELAEKTAQAAKAKARAAKAKYKKARKAAKQAKKAAKKAKKHSVEMIEALQLLRQKAAKSGRTALAQTKQTPDKMEKAPVRDRNALPEGSRHGGLPALTPAPVAAAAPAKKIRRPAPKIKPPEAEPVEQVPEPTTPALAEAQSTPDTNP